MKSKILDQILSEVQACGHKDIRVRDVAFAILNYTLKSPELAFAVIFPDENPKQSSTYAKTPAQKVITQRIKAILKSEQMPNDKPKPKKEVSHDEITADENRAEIMRSIQRLEDMKNTITDLTPKDLIAIEKQLLQSRTALKEKFEVSTQAESQLIIVQPKFNHICEHTGRECWLQTKEYAMEHWGLIDPNDNQ